MISNRRGYQMMKAVMENDPRAACLVIDDQGRANRSSIEALQLGQMMRTCEKRMVGASDGFDSDSESSKIMLHVYAMLHEL